MQRSVAPNGATDLFFTISLPYITVQVGNPEGDYRIAGRF